MSRVARGSHGRTNATKRGGKRRPSTRGMLPSTEYAVASSQSARQQEGQARPARRTGSSSQLPSEQHVKRVNCRMNG